MKMVILLECGTRILIGLIAMLNFSHGFKIWLALFAKRFDLECGGKLQAKHRFRTQLRQTNCQLR
ncbi:MAG: hypothetical protein ACI8UO_003456 [Verrucomicrobiales bacterium]|jgi:hypothetical protein